MKLMKRYTLKLKNGFSIVDEDGWGRFIGNGGNAFDLDKKIHSELIKKTIENGKIGVSSEYVKTENNSEGIEAFF